MIVCFFLNFIHFSHILSGGPIWSWCFLVFFYYHSCHNFLLKENENFLLCFILKWTLKSKNFLSDNLLRFAKEKKETFSFLKKKKITNCSRQNWIWIQISSLAYLLWMLEVMCVIFSSLHVNFFSIATSTS